MPELHSKNRPVLAGRVEPKRQNPMIENPVFAFLGSGFRFQFQVGCVRFSFLLECAGVAVLPDAESIPPPR